MHEFQANKSPCCGKRALLQDFSTTREAFA
jgi:hypothetical protein